MGDPNSSFFLVTEEHFRKLADQTVQDVLKTRHIVITERQQSVHGFDLGGLETLAGLEQPIAVYGKLNTPIKVRLLKHAIRSNYSSRK